LDKSDDAGREEPNDQGNREDQEALRRGLSIGFDGGFDDLDDGGVFGLIEPCCVILLDKEIEEGLPVPHFMVGAEIFEASARNIL
jgi:hypothetical protein